MSKQKCPDCGLPIRNVVDRKNGGFLPGEPILGAYNNHPISPNTHWSCVDALHEEVRALRREVRRLKARLKA